MNGFRLAADAIHLLSKLILIATIHKRKSAEGVSFLTQSLYALVFVTRYLDLLAGSFMHSVYNTVFKLFYIGSSFYILFLMLNVYQRSREEEKEWRISAYILGFSIVGAPIVQAILGPKMSLIEIFWTFSIILESLAILPQLSLLRHSSIPTAITSYYLLAIGSYRALYIPNWIVRALDKKDGFTEPIAVIFGVIQTLLYVEFAWIYWGRQKVKLRAGGGELDDSDLARGLILGRLIGTGTAKIGNTQTGGSWRTWGRTAAAQSGGLSISADQDFGIVGSDTDSEHEFVREGEEDDEGSDVESRLIRGRS